MMAPCKAGVPVENAAEISSNTGTGRPLCGTQNIRYMKNVTDTPPAPSEARK